MTNRDPAQVRYTAREILQRKEFRNERSLGRRISDWLHDPLTAIGHLFAKVKQLLGGGDGPVVATAAWVFTLAVVLIVVFLVVKFARTSSSDEVVDVRSPKKRGRTVDELIEEAERLEALGDWRRAIRARHAALVINLADRGLVRRQAGMTAREYALEVSRNAPVASTSFDAATSLFEWVWYGAGTPREIDVRQFKDFADEVHRKVAV